MCSECECQQRATHAIPARWKAKFYECRFGNPCRQRRHLQTTLPLTPPHSCCVVATKRCGHSVPLIMWCSLVTYPSLSRTAHVVLKFYPLQIKLAQERWHNLSTWISLFIMDSWKYWRQSATQWISFGVDKFTTLWWACVGRELSQIPAYLRFSRPRLVISPLA